MIYIVNSPKMCCNYFSGTLFLEKVDICTDKAPQCGPSGAFRGSKKYARKKLQPFLCFWGESSSSKCPRPAQVVFNTNFRGVGSNPGWGIFKKLPLFLGFQTILLLSIQGIRNNAMRVSAIVFEILFKSHSAYCAVQYWQFMTF